MEPKLNYTQSDLHEVGQKVYERWAEQMPVLEEMNEELKADELSCMMLLPAIVHNLSVIVPEQIHKLITPAFMLYAKFEIRGKCIAEIREVVKKTRTILRNLKEQEEKGQAAQAKCEEEYRQHVECDMSGFFQSFVFLVISGYKPNDDQLEIVKDIVRICRDICNVAIEKGKTALETSKKMM